MAWVHRETFGQSLDSGVVDADPTLAGGLAAPIGSVALFGGLTFTKTGAAATAWTLLNVSGGDGISLNSTTGVLDIDPDGTTISTSGGQVIALVGGSQSAHGTNNADTSSVVPVLIEGAGNTEQMTLTAPADGVYMIWLSVECTIIAGPETVEISLYNNGVQTTGGVMGRRVANAVDIGSSSLHDRITCTSGHVIEGRFRSIGGNGVRITNRHLSAMRVS
jgi:hypothetical protein